MSFRKRGGSRRPLPASPSTWRASSLGPATSSSRPSERYYVVYDFETIPPDDPASGTATEGTDYIRRSIPEGCDLCYQ